MYRKLVRDAVDHSDRTRRIHVVCPENCGNDNWVTKYEPGTVPQCGQHDGPRIPMVPCGPRCQHARTGSN